MTELPSNQHITYQLQYRKCGKPTCSTCRHSQGHGPYWYVYWHEGSRLRSGYIGKVRPASLDTSVRPASPDTSTDISGSVGTDKEHNEELQRSR